MRIVYKQEDWETDFTKEKHEELKNQFPNKFILIHRDVGGKRENKEVKISETYPHQNPLQYFRSNGWI